MPIPLLQGLDRAIPDPSRAVVGFVKIRGQRPDALPVDAPGVLAVFRPLIFQVVGVHQSQKAEVPMVIIVPPSRPVLLGQFRFTEPDVQAGRREVHLPHRLGGIAGLAEQGRDRGCARWQCAMIVPAAMLMDRQPA